MHPLDFITIGGAAGAFAVFFIFQMIIFRIFHQEAVLKAIVIIFLLASVVHMLGLSSVLSDVSFENLTAADKIMMIAASYVMFGLTAFVYILCVFGPSETSIRIRVVRELASSGPQGLSHEQLMSRYNARMVLERRLERLTRSGEIVLRNGKYALIKKANVFFLIDAVANIIHGFIKNK